MSGAPTIMGTYPVRQAHEGWHDRTENHDQAMVGRSSG